MTTCFTSTLLLSDIFALYCSPEALYHIVLQLRSNVTGRVTMATVYAKRRIGKFILDVVNSMLLGTTYQN